MVSRKINTLKTFSTLSIILQYHKDLVDGTKSRVRSTIRFNVVGGLILSSQIMLVCIKFKISEIFCKIADMPQMLDV